VYIMKDTAIEYSKSLCENFKKRWIELKGNKSIVGEDTWNGLNDSSIAGQISKIKSDGKSSNFIMWCGWTNNGSMMRQVRSAGIELPVVGSEAMDGSYWLQAVPDLSNFYVAVYASIHGNDPDARIQKFMQTYKAKFGEAAPMGHVITGYAAVEAWAKAANRAGKVEPSAIKTALDSFKDEPLITGPATFTPDLHINLKLPMLLMHADKGSFKPIDRIRPEKVDPPQF
jgi:branched-chain amino acid transport system substrate-binding protein